MITAIDTNVLLDVLGADPAFGPGSRAALTACFESGRVIGSDVVWAEVASVFPTADFARETLADVGLRFEPVSEAAALAAGSAWASYRKRGGSRTRLVADFLIGAHALVQADRLLTRDRGFYRTYFRGLEVVDPTR